MRKRKFSESQIVHTLKQLEGGREVKDLCWEPRMADATYSVWKSTYGGMKVSDMQLLHELKD